MAETCLNVGSGLSWGRSWLNVDASPSLRIARWPLVGRLIARGAGFPAWPSAVVWGDLVRGLRLGPGCCRLVFASHVLEHLSEPDAFRALTNVYRWLAPGGVLRAIVPDLEVLAGEYLAEVGAPGPRAAEAAPRFLERAQLGLRETRIGLRARARETLSNSRHQWMWDRPSLESALRRVGFRDVAWRKYGEWADERYAEVEEEGRHQDAICAEARKPGG